MSSLQRLLDNFERQVSLPVVERLPAAQRVWFVLYSPEQERRIRFLLPDFKLCCEKHGKIWSELDLTNAVPMWVSKHEYRDEYLNDPSLLEEQTIQNALSEIVANEIGELRLSSTSLFVLFGLGGLFGFAHISELVKSIQDLVPGRLVCFFPGSRDQNSYHFMNERDGWNYHALPITDEEGFLNP